MAMIKNGIKIEFAQFADAAEIGILSKNEIEYGLGWKYRPERIVRLIRNSSKNVVVARSDSALVGFGIMSYQETQANLDLLAVKPGFRRMKVGTDLVQWLEKVALNAGVFNVFVQVRERNADAIAFYKHLDYCLVDRDKRYYRGVEAGVLMAKSLRGMLNFHSEPG
ncbi:MAG: GNAT family N-acetyltransferase [Candidatus Thiodiazotropha sp. (ex Lucina pensylvanica)]|nr:GNAT family N-acetyltransferase [Candidatus Thiodiazotropha taylori]MBT3058687.1 GNAT family N-acetyltransferase [Candidatus Thiodiazotropha sp. (ex Lucina pensylvanica)]MBT3064382.1 GNAT family N-acetyltransferase [Candidatus Thiodiazotropha sp. (ex Lucina pensylvanica)]MBV2097084.1 GNAT family N-acetyltransferase [Candidatus Thiodiazotropha sp. (ex Codakia orbicularis)]